MWLQVFPTSLTVTVCDCWRVQLSATECYWLLQMFPTSLTVTVCDCWRMQLSATECYWLLQVFHNSLLVTVCDCWRVPLSATDCSTPYTQLYANATSATDCSYPLHTTVCECYECYWLFLPPTHNCMWMLRVLLIVPTPTHNCMWMLRVLLIVPTPTHNCMWVLRVLLIVPTPYRQLYANATSATDCSYPLQTTVCECYECYWLFLSPTHNCMGMLRGLLIVPTPTDNCMRMLRVLLIVPIPYTQLYVNATSATDCSYPLHTTVCECYECYWLLQVISYPQYPTVCECYECYWLLHVIYCPYTQLYVNATSATDCSKWFPTPIHYCM